MKAELIEDKGEFRLQMTPEDMKETAMLIRFGMNNSKEIQRLLVSVNPFLEVEGVITIGKKKNTTDYIAK